MPIGTPVAGAFAYSASGGTSVSPSYPAGILSTDALILIIGQKPSAANGGTVTAPAGWTLQAGLTGAGGYGTTLGADTGNTNLRLYRKDEVFGSETGALAVTLAGNGVSWAAIVRVPTGGGTLSLAATTGSDTSAGNIVLPGAADPGFIADDMALWAMCIPTDVTTPSQFSSHDIVATGATFGAATELGEADSGVGQDIGGFLVWAMVTAGTSSAAPIFQAAAAGTTTNVRGPGVVLRIREAVAVNYVYKGSAGWPAAYKGTRTDAQLYKGVKTLHP